MYGKLLRDGKHIENRQSHISSLTELLLLLVLQLGYSFCLLVSNNAWGSHLLSAIVQMTAGTTVHEFAKETLFKPLGITLLCGTRSRVLNDISVDFYFALGLWGQLVVVVPKIEMVGVFTSRMYHDSLFGLTC